MIVFYFLCQLKKCIANYNLKFYRLQGQMLIIVFMELHDKKNPASRAYLQ